MAIITPTTLTKDQIVAFQKLYSEELQEKINLEEAERKGLMLIPFMAFIFQLSSANFPDD